MACEDNYRYPGKSPDLINDIHPGNVRQENVTQHDIRLLRPDEFNSFGATRSSKHIIAGKPELYAQEITYRRFVINDEHTFLGVHCRSLYSIFQLISKLVGKVTITHLVTYEEARKMTFVEISGA